MRCSQIKPGDVLTWEETLCPHRGTYREHREVVRERRGKNILTVSGLQLYWGERGLGSDSTKVISK